MPTKEVWVDEAAHQSYFSLTRQLALSPGGIAFSDASRAFLSLYSITFTFFFSCVGK